jgi:hypothetical protein
MTMPAKNVVRSGSNPPSQPSQPGWRPAPEAKQQSTTFRIVAAVLWLLAIAGEAYAIFGLLRQNPVNMTLLIVAIVVVGVLAVIGDVLWKRANVMDPASTSEPVRFFVQNQLGAIIGMIAFLPMIVMIFLNKNMNGQQKGIAGGIGIVALIIATFMGVSLNPPSVEQYTQAQATQLALTSVPLSAGTSVPQANGTSAQQSAQQFPDESAVVVGYTGQDLVFWKIDSTVYHLCQAASALQRENSKDNTIYSGTVADAHAAGKDRLTLQVQEELKQCGYSSSASASPTP